MSIAAGEQQPRKRRTRRLVFRAVLGCGVFVLLVIAVAAVILVPTIIDEEPFVAPDLEVVIPEVPPEENAALAFLEIWADGLPDEQEYSEDFEWSFAYDDRAMLPFLEANPKFVEYWGATTRMLERVDEASHLPRCQFEIRLGFEVPTKWSDDARQTAEAYLHRAQILFEENKSGELLDALESLVRFSARLGSGVLSRNMHLFCASPIASGAIYGIREYLSATTGDLRELLGVVQEVRTDRERISEGWRIEFQGYRDLLQSSRLLDGLPKEPLILSHLFHPNATERLFGEAIRGYIEEWERTGRLTQIPDYPEPSGVWDSLSKGNVTGRTLATLVTTNEESLARSEGLFISRVRVTELMIGLVIFEEANGRLPEKLSELVPEFLDQIPQDPFRDQPLRYDRERRVVWSVGYDGVDDGGMDTSGRWDAADSAIEIPKRGE